MNEKAVKNQHYVSQFYLRKWAEDGRKVNTYIDGGKKKIIPMLTENVATSTYFYKIQRMTDETYTILDEQLKSINILDNRCMVKILHEEIRNIDYIEKLCDELSHHKMRTISSLICDLEQQYNIALCEFIKQFKWDVFRDIINEADKNKKIQRAKIIIDLISVFRDLTNGFEPDNITKLREENEENINSTLNEIIKNKLNDNNWFSIDEIKNYIDMDNRDFVNKKIKFSGILFVYDFLNENKNDSIDNIILKMKKCLEAKRSNVIENYYSEIENEASKVINKIINSEYDSFDMYEYQIILKYSYYQLVRTKVVREGIERDISKLLKEKNIDFVQYWVLSSIYYAELFFERSLEKLFVIKVIENNTGINFITNDNPVFNLNGVDNEDVKLYFPISPKKAIYIEKINISDDEKEKLKNKYLEERSGKYFLHHIEINKDEVLELNKEIWKRKERFCFSLNKNELEVYLE